MKQYKRQYDPKLIPYSKSLRKNSTLGERLLWKYLRKRQILGYKFRRQYPILNYILDFYCPELKLAIEIDGASHDESKYEYDLKRQKEVEAYGVIFLRFTEYEVRENAVQVADFVQNKICYLRGGGWGRRVMIK